MVRMVIKKASGPFEIKPQKESIWICMCGLTKNEPFCNGTHKLCGGEEGEKIYEYDENGTRKEISER